MLTNRTLLICLELLLYKNKLIFPLIKKTSNIIIAGNYNFEDTFYFEELPISVQM